MKSADSSDLYACLSSNLLLLSAILVLFHCCLSKIRRCWTSDCCETRRFPLCEDQIPFDLLRCLLCCCRYLLLLEILAASVCQCCWTLATLQEGPQVLQGTRGVGSVIQNRGHHNPSTWQICNEQECRCKTVELGSLQAARPMQCDMTSGITNLLG